MKGGINFSAMVFIALSPVLFQWAFGPNLKRSHYALVQHCE